MVGTYWKCSQEYPIAKYLNLTEEQVENIGYSGTLTVSYDLRFFSENDAKMRILLSGKIYQQFADDSEKILYANVNKNELFDMSYTLNGWSGMLTAIQESTLWQYPPVKFTLYENTVYLILEIDNQEVVFKMVDPLELKDAGDL